MNDCLVCQKHARTVNVPGGFIYEDPWTLVSHAQLFGDEKSHYLGHVFVETRRHVAEMADLTEEEAAAVGAVLQRTSRALMDVLGMVHVYAFVIGDGVPHVHVHVIGRYPGAPKPYWGPRVDEWPEAPRGGPEAIADVAERLRKALSTPARAARA